tara:strand:+ start:605 stop:1843 length:1239 start_codon:yes stop_codon:yes gene_type:complete
MAKTKKEEVVDSTTEKVVKETTKQPEDNKTKGDVIKVKEKMTMKPQVMGETITKVDLSKPPKTEENADTKQETTNVVEDKQAPVVEEVVEKVPQEQDTVQNETTPVVEEIKEEEKKEIEQAKEEVVKAVEEAETTGEPLPENIDKLMKFMEDTGGDLEDYVKLNRDVSKLDDQDVLYEYYKETKPHLNNEEINFLMNDEFEYDEENDEEKTIKRKKLALKEQVASARAHLDGQKSKYYEEIKAGSKLTPDQQKAIDFFNRYNKESEEAKKVAEQQKSAFNKKTNEVFNDEFKGFEYNVGDKKFRFNVKDADKVKDTQSSINNFAKKFLDDKNIIKDAEGYHKSIFTAMNADSIAQHFYEQGKADAIKDTVAKDKNININPRQSHGEVEAGGIKVRVLGENTSDFKFKIKNKR